MDIRDFQGLTKYKVVIPALYLISWISMFMGPSFYPIIYQRFTLVCLLIGFIKITSALIGMIVATVKSQEVFRRIKQMEDQQQYHDLPGSASDEILYGFIIPNYKEDYELICQTLQVLAAHHKAKTHYLVFLAMEAHEPGSEEKAQKLIQAFKEYFRVISYSIHQIREHEQKGKASNVSWCAEHLEPVFQKHMIDPDSVMLTIIDADSWAPEIYFTFLEQKIRQEYEDRYMRIYLPTQIFTRNNL